MKDILLRTVQREVKEAGAKSVAASVGIPHERLLQKANPNYDRSPLNLVEFAAVVQATGSHYSLDVLAESIGRITVPMPECCSSDKDLLMQAIDLNVECCSALKRIKNATRPDSEMGEKLTRREKAEIDEVLSNTLEILFCLRQRVHND